MTMKNIAKKTDTTAYTAIVAVGTMLVLVAGLTLRGVDYLLGR